MIPSIKHFFFFSTELPASAGRPETVRFTQKRYSARIFEKIIVYNSVKKKGVLS